MRAALGNSRAAARATRDRRLGRAAALAHIVARSCEIKADVVSQDETESGLRATLNYGHTIGHALEAETEYEQFLHGEAVAFGMRAATALAQRTGDLNAADRAMIVSLSCG